MAGRRVLITGVASYVGASLAARLESDPTYEYVGGVDTRAPRVELSRTELLDVDLRDPELVRLLPTTQADTVVHNQIVRRPGPGMSPRAMHELNVIGTLQLLAACERTPTIRTIVIRGSAGVYGAEPHAPQFFGEQMASEVPPRTRFQRDVAEIETTFDSYARRHPEVICTMLRYQPAIGPSLDTQVTRYLSLPACPAYLGFDPRLQLVHERDAVDALAATVARPVRGAVNVAGAGTIGLTRMIRLAGKPRLPLATPLFSGAVAAMRRAGAAELSEDFQRLLRYGRAVDIARLTEEVGYTPAPLDAVGGRGVGSRPRRAASAAATRGRDCAWDRRSPVSASSGTGDSARREQAGEPGAERDYAGAISFLRRFRRGLDAGLDLPDALARGAGELPHDARASLAALLRRLEGEYAEDDWGFDEELADLAEPFFEFLYDRWWRVQAVGAARVPAHGRALLVANHAGILPWDATMIGVAVLREHPLPRHPRFLVLDWAFDLPFVSIAMRKLGGVMASPDNARSLLEQDHLVAVFPEGVKGTGKDWSERYRLQRFGRGGFVEVALRTGAPIVPVAVVGSEEIYPKLGELRPLAKLLGAPYFPVTPTFPWLGPLGMVPLPSKWRIEFCEPIDTTRYGPDAADDRALVLELSARVRDTIQQTVYDNLVARGGAFLP